MCKCSTKLIDVLSRISVRYVAVYAVGLFSLFGAQAAWAQELYAPPGAVATRWTKYGSRHSEEDCHTHCDGADHSVRSQ